MTNEQQHNEQQQMESTALEGINGQFGNGETENQFITFRIGEEEYGIDIMLVQEIVRYSKPTRVANANPFIKGVINFRGQVIPVIDMHRKFNLPQQEYDDFTVVIIIEVQHKTMGMIVDRVSDIMSFKNEDIQVVDQEFADDVKTEHLKGMGKSGDRIVMLLDPNRVLSFKEMKQLEQVAAAGEIQQKSQDQ